MGEAILYGQSGGSKNDVEFGERSALTVTYGNTSEQLNCIANNTLWTSNGTYIQTYDLITKTVIATKSHVGIAIGGTSIPDPYDDCFYTYDSTNSYRLLKIDKYLNIVWSAAIYGITDSSQLVERINRFCIGESFIYFIDKDSYLHKINKETGASSSTIANANVFHISVDERNGVGLYGYINSSGLNHVIFELTTLSTIVSGVVGVSATASPNTYTLYLDNQNIYLRSTNKYFYKNNWNTALPTVYQGRDSRTIISSRISLDFKYKDKHFIPSEGLVIDYNKESEYRLPISLNLFNNQVTRNTKIYPKFYYIQFNATTFYIGKVRF